MEKPLNTFRWYDNLWAALIFFTRLPFWRLHQPPKSSYAAVVEWWPLVGWLTGGLMAATLWLASLVMPLPLALIIAIIGRLLLTGALHEDGLADFADGFGGGGNDRDRILAIMKDSHIGTYGVIALIAYFALLFTALHTLGSQPSPITWHPSPFTLHVPLAALAILAADPFAKMVTSQLILMMPYARTEETAKNRTVYRRPTTRAGFLLALQGLLPLAALLWLMNDVLEWSTLIFVPCLVMYILYRLIWSRLHGYTGDCCGAVCLLTELSFYLALCVQLHI